jgi:hypothetical protein
MTKTIVVAGDVAIDWIGWEEKSGESGCNKEKSQPNWTTYTSLQMRARPGGAMLLAHMLKKALDGIQPGIDIISYSLDNPEKIPPDEIIHSNTLLGSYGLREGDKSGNFVYRVKKYYGFSGPVDRKVIPRDLGDNPDSADMVILDDAGNGFRDSENVWPKCIKNPDCRPWVILKMSRTLAEGALWDYLQKHHKEKLIVMVNAKDLRECGANISYRLSWEKTAEDFLWQVQNNIKINPLTDCRALVVRFGTEGTILYTTENDHEEARLLYDPGFLENGFSDQYPGKMQGVFCAFIAGFIKNRVESGNTTLEDQIRTGVISSRNLVKEGFGPTNKRPDYYIDGIFNINELHLAQITSIKIPDPVEKSLKGISYWTILETLTRTQLEDIAWKTVLFGKDPSLNPVPIASFGALKTIDRQEIEAYQSIRNIFHEFITSKRSKPLSIAVFGPPGSGKSFGVTQLAAAVGKDSIQKIEFNLSQFNDASELRIAFHKIRDIVLTGKIPLVFFDEFDSNLNGRLGWLKYFLAPMQDGEFKDGEVMHPVGKAIFVFAGGTKASFEEFCTGSEKDDKEGYEKEFRLAKGTDFISRLRGFINILGCNPAEGSTDRNFIMRRALLLRSFIEKDYHDLIEHGEAHIDEGVIRAFLKVPKYRHGARSMQAILDMSMLSEKRKFDPSSLPSKEQLRLHVDEETFISLAVRDELLQDAVETIALEIHRQYLDTMKSIGGTSRANVPWEQLDDSFKESNREQAAHIPVKLNAIDCGFIPKNKSDIVVLTLSSDEEKILAKLEHTRWVEERLRKGWKCGSPRDDDNKIHPDLVEWNELTPSTKQKDYDAVKQIPGIMANVGFEVYRLN